MMKVWSITRKTLLELLREPLLIGLFIGFPLILVGFYYIAFGESADGVSATLNVLVINQDDGVTLSTGQVWNAGDHYLDLIRAVTVKDQPIFDVQLTTDRDAALIVVRERKAALLVTIPHDFSQVMTSALNGAAPPDPVMIMLEGDSFSDNYVFARNALDKLTRGYVRGVLDQSDPPVNVVYETTAGTDVVSDFEFGISGIIVFGVMFVIISTAELLVRENVYGTLRRLRLTRLRARDLLLGVTVAQMVLGAIQVPLTFGAAVALGFDGRGSLLLAIGISLLLSLSAVGLGLVVACFARNDGEAANLASGVLVPMVLMSGALFPLPEAVLLTVQGRAIQVYDLLPTAHASTALREVLLYGKSASSIGYELAAMTVLSLLLFAVGIWLYQRLQLRRLA